MNTVFFFFQAEDGIRDIGVTGVQTCALPISAAFAALASLLLASVLVAFTLRQLAAGRRVQERLQEAQKMEALGQITGGIAHDFNNLLTPIIGGLEVVARKAQLEGVSRRLLEGALSSARRAAKLTGQLLAFSRRQKME